MRLIACLGSLSVLARSTDWQIVCTKRKEMKIQKRKISAEWFILSFQNILHIVSSNQSLNLFRKTTKMSWIKKLLYDRDFLVIIWPPPHVSICQNTKNLLDPTKLYKFCGPGGILRKFYLGSSCTLIKYPFLFLYFHVPSLWPNGLSGFPGAYWQAHKARLVLCRLAWIYFSADLLSTFDHRTFY